MTKEQKIKKQQRNQLIIGIILIIVMLFGTVGYSFLGRQDTQEQKITYKGIEFYQGQNRFWNFQVQQRNFQTTYSPIETQNISVNIIDSFNNYAGKPLYYISDFNEPIGEIIKNFA